MIFSIKPPTQHLIDVGMGFFRGNLHFQKKNLIFYHLFTKTNHEKSIKHEFEKKIKYDLNVSEKIILNRIQQLIIFIGNHYFCVLISVRTRGNTYFYSQFIV